MADVEHIQSDAPEELVDLTKVRAMVREFKANGDAEHAVALLGQVARWPDSTRYIEDNLWLYRQLGDLSVGSSTDEAMNAYKRGYQLDPRDLGISKPYSELLFATDQVDHGVEVVRSMLLHHKQSLSSQELATIYCRLGGLYEKAGDHQQARTGYEKALEHFPDHTDALEGLLRVVAAVAEPMDVVRVRQKLIRSLGNSVARSKALVALGDDWLNEFNDPGRALDVYEQAVAEWQENPEALERIARVGQDIGDWRRVGRAYFTLSQLTQDHAEQADWIFHSSQVARDHLWEADKALTGFRKALELDPTRADIFKALTSILVDAKDWEELERAYVQFIGTTLERDPAPPNLLAVLWRRLGDLYKTHLNKLDDAVFAYQQSARYTPDDASIHHQVVELTESQPDHLDQAVEHLRALWRLEANPAVLDRIGRVYLRQKSIDKALCVFRVLQVLDFELDSKARDFVNRCDTAMFRPIRGTLTPNLLKRSLYSEQLIPALNEVFDGLKIGLDEWCGESLSRYGLKRRDRVKIEDQLAFNSIYRSIGGSLGYQTLPDLWHKPEQVGLINGALIPPGMIAGDDLLNSGREEFMAFVIAKQLFLFQRPFYLAAIRKPSDLQVFYGLGASHVLPNIKLELTKDRESALKAIKKRIKGQDAERLKAAYGKAGGEPDIPGWVNAIEESANRVGLLFSDDIRACVEYLKVEPQKVGDRSLEDRIRSLVDFAISEKFFELRETLGLCVN